MRSIRGLFGAALSAPAAPNGRPRAAAATTGRISSSRCKRVSFVLFALFFLTFLALLGFAWLVGEALNHAWLVPAASVLLAA